METFVYDARALRVGMAQRGIRSVSRLARLSGLSESYGRQIAHGLVPSQAVRERIALLLRVDVSSIWRPVDDDAAVQ